MWTDFLSFCSFSKVLVTDGLTSVMSEQEIVDIVRRKQPRGCKNCCAKRMAQVKKGADPTMSTKKLVDIADQYGTEDNCTAMVSYHS